MSTTDPTQALANAPEGFISDQSSRSLSVANALTDPQATTKAVYHNDVFDK